MYDVCISTFISVIRYSSQYLDFTSKYVRTYSRTLLHMDGTINWPNPYLVDWKNLIFSKSNLKYLDENASLSMSKLRTWSTLIFAMPFVKIFNTTPNSESISNSQIRSKSVICQKMPAFEQLKNQLLGNSKKYLSPH